MIKLTLPGTVRIKKNNRRIFRIGKQNKSLPSKAYEQWEYDSRIIIKPQLIEQLYGLIDCPLRIKAIFYYKGQRPDLQGAFESLADCLEGIIYKDDKQIESWDGSRLVHDLKNPRTEVWISKYTEELL